MKNSAHQQILPADRNERSRLKTVVWKKKRLAELIEAAESLLDAINGTSPRAVRLLKAIEAFREQRPREPKWRYVPLNPACPGMTMVTGGEK